MDFSSLLLPLLLVLFVLPLFLASRKQKRLVAQQQELQNSMEPGDEVMTTSGLYAIVVGTDDEDTIDLEIAPGVRTKWLRAAVREKVQPPVDETEDTDEDEDTEVSTATTAEVAPPLEQGTKGR
jgi:preprotein translocase subunit YajC